MLKYCYRCGDELTYFGSVHGWHPALFLIGDGFTIWQLEVRFSFDAYRIPLIRGDSIGHNARDNSQGHFSFFQIDPILGLTYAGSDHTRRHPEQRRSNPFEGSPFLFRRCLVK